MKTLPRSASQEYLNSPDKLTKKFVGVEGLKEVGIDKYAISMKPKKCNNPIAIQCRRKDAEMIYWLFGQKIPSSLS